MNMSQSENFDLKINVREKFYSVFIVIISILLLFHSIVLLYELDLTNCKSLVLLVACNVFHIYTIEFIAAKNTKSFQFRPI